MQYSVRVFVIRYFFEKYKFQIAFWEIIQTFFHVIVSDNLIIIGVLIIFFNTVLYLSSQGLPAARF